MATVPGTTGTTVNQVELAALSLQQGLAPANAIIATAIAMAENRGSVSSTGANIPTNVLNNTEGQVSANNADYSVGPWQINFTAAAGGRNRFGSSPELATNPFENARLMGILSNNGTNFRPWTTYTSNTYLAFIPQATVAVGTAIAGGVTSYLDDISARLGGNASPGGGSGGSTNTNPGGSSSGGSSSGGGAPSLPADVTPGFLIIFAAILLLIIGAIIWGKMFSVQGPKTVIQLGPKPQRVNLLGGSGGSGNQPVPKPPSVGVSRTRQTGTHTYHTRTVVIKHK